MKKNFVEVAFGLGKRRYNMAKKKNTALLITFGVLAVVGGAVHALGAYNTFDLLSLFGGASKIVQLVAGVGGILAGFTLLKK